MENCVRVCVSCSALTVYFVEREKRTQVASAATMDCDAIPDLGNKTLVVPSHSAFVSPLLLRERSCVPSQCGVPCCCQVEDHMWQHFNRSYGSIGRLECFCKVGVSATSFVA